MTTKSTSHKRARWSAARKRKFEAKRAAAAGTHTDTQSAGVSIQTPQANGYLAPMQRDQAQLQELNVMLVGARAALEAHRRDVTNIQDRIKLLRAQIAGRPAGETKTATASA